MSSIVEQNLLWKAYQQHKSILNNCSIFGLDKQQPQQHIFNTTDQAVNDKNIFGLNFDDDDIHFNNISSYNDNDNNNNDIINNINTNPYVPCDSKIMSDIGSIIKQLDRLIINATNNNNINQHHQILDESLNDDNQSTLLSSQSSFGINQARSDQFYIDYPHDMLHPSMNPSFMPIIITHTITFLIGVIGNSVVIATWSMHGKFRSPTAVFLVSLAIADLLLLLVFVPLETLEYFMITWTGLSSICKMIAYVEAISAMSTVMNLLAVSIERFLVIVYPMRARSWCTMSSTRKGLIIIWSFAFVLSTPVLLTRHTSQITYYNMTTSLTLYYCFDVENDLTFIVAIYQLLVMFVLPALFMVVCYYVVIRQLWSSTRSVNMMTQAENKARQAFVSRKSDSTLFCHHHQQQQQQPKINHKRNYSHQFDDNEKSFSTDFTQIISNYQQQQQQSRHPSINEITNESINLTKILSQQQQQQQSNRINNNAKSYEKNQKMENLDENQSNQNSIMFINNDEFCKVIKQQQQQDRNDNNNEKYSMTSFIDDDDDCIGKIPEKSINSNLSNNNKDTKHVQNHQYQQQQLLSISGLLKNDNNNQRKQSIDNVDHDDYDEQIEITNMRSNKNNDIIHPITTTTTTNHRKSSSSTTLCHKSCSRTLSSNVMEITKSRIQVIKMLVLIIILFLLCWGPRLIMNVLVKSGLTLNPFVYGFMSSNFRSMVCSSFGRRRRRLRDRQKFNNNNNTGKNIPLNSHHHDNYNNNRRI
ncbi:uncharacterized protein LOC113799853 isoform X2 [Dermatophagoides pteronyssinus]|uniref:uncharacterized protein LOC113799853 isoform X2 n=1 Tax=Dermatophagoides pteronyssinus TaxID=6956 RepID=UPI003F681074